MRIVYSPSADQVKTWLLRKYKGIDTYFDRLEDQILLSPYEAAEEKHIIEGTVVPILKRNFKTGLFSGNVRASYLYLSMSYIVNEASQRIVIVGAYVHNYPD